MLCSPRLWSRVPAVLEGRLGPVEVLHAGLDQASVEACADAVLAAAPPRFALAGHSLGGIVAMALVRRAPERVTRLALLATSARPPTPEQRTAWQRTLDGLAAGRSARAVQRDLLPVLLGPQAAPEHAAQALAMADDVGERALAAQLAAQASRVDERPGLPAVAVPTLVVAGADDRLTPLAKLEEVHALVPGARLVVVPGAGHLVPLEAADAVGAALADWLSPWPA